jgi:hypothetical protein
LIGDRASQGKEDRSTQREIGINKVDGRLRFFHVMVDFDSGSQGEGDLACLSTKQSYQDGALA